MRNAAIVLALLTLAALPAAAQIDANNARGFEAGKVYNFFGLDAVSTFNGNMNLRIPIGQTYGLRPGFAYQFMLTYNSKVWDYETLETNPGGSVRNALPETYSNAGLGWVFGLGKVLVHNRFRQWTYVAPDGTHHDFGSNSAGTGVLYTKDSSYMRMKLTPADAQVGQAATITVETADGIKSTFNAAGDLVEMIDGFGNWVRVAYNGLVWTITDGFGNEVMRTHRITFELPPAAYDSTNPNFAKRIKTIELAAFPAEEEDERTDTFATYTFEYSDTHIDNGGCGTPARNGWEPKATYNVPLLTKVTLPDLSTFVPSYNKTNDMAPCSSGTLAKLVLPTKGALAWKHGRYELSRAACYEDPFAVEDRWSDPYTGVTERWMEDASGAKSMIVTYVPVLEPGPLGSFVCGKNNVINQHRAPTLFHNTVTSAGAAVKHHFSAYHAFDSALPEPNAKLVEYGLPFTRSVTSDGLFLSTETRAAGDTTVLRSTYVAYAMDSTVGTSAPNSREISRRTVFNDDTGDSGPEGDPDALRCKTANVVGPCWIQTAKTDYAQFGNYRTETTTSNFVGSATRTSERQFNPTNLTAQSWPSGRLWFLGEYTTSSVTEGTATRSTTTTFDTAKGVITSVQTGSGTGSLLSATCRNARGWITSERSLGGDSRTPSTTPCGAISRSPGEFFLDHTYDLEDPDTIVHTAKWNGNTLAISPPDASVAMTDLVVDETLDRNTGLPITTTDGAGLDTSYAFDAMSRITSLTPPGLAATTFTYDNATVNGNVFTPAQVTSSTASATPANGVLWKQYQYDALGRLWREKILMPDATTSVRETLYDADNYKASVSELEKLTIPAGQTEYAFVPSHRTTFTNYDPFGRATTITAPGDSTTTFVYTGARKTARTVSIAGIAGAQNVTTVEESDAHGRLVAVTEDASGTAPLKTGYQYDPNGNLTNVNMAGQTRTFTYDERGLLTGESHPESGSTTYSGFDARGQASTRTTPTATLTFTRDDAGRVMAISAAAEAIKLFRFDPATGRLLATARFNQLPNVGNIAVTESTQYDANSGIPSRRDRAVGNGTGFTGRSFAHTESHDDLGMLAAINYPFDTVSGDSPRWSLSLTNRNGRLTQVPGWATITYQPNGLIATVTHNGGVAETWTADPDGMPRPAAITVKRGTTTLWTSGNYAFDGTGNISAIGTTSYRYDGFGRLTYWAEQLPGTLRRQRVEYDAFGNQIAFTIGGCTASRCSTTGSSARTIDGVSNRYAGVTYDGSGNVLSDGARTFTYDAVNMPVTVTAGGRTFLYVYDVDDERIAALERTAPNTYQTTWTLRGFDQQLLSIRTANSWKEDYIRRGSSLLGYRTAAGTKQHYSLDHLGSPRAITSDTGALVGTQSFHPFGAGGTTGSGALQFTGHERDSANLGGGTVDLPDYVHARLLDVGWGRFLAVDPTWESADLGKPQSWNRYAYVANNPVNVTDPDGRCPTCLITGELPNERLGFAFRFIADYVLPDGDTPLTEPEYSANADKPNLEKPAVLAAVVSTAPVDEVLTRRTNMESAKRLADRAASAEEKIGIHGVSASAKPPAAGETVAAQAARSEVEKVFKVHDTPTMKDPLHRTIELPKPITNRIAKIFNRIFKAIQ